MLAALWSFASILPFVLKRQKFAYLSDSLLPQKPVAIA